MVGGARELPDMGLPGRCLPLTPAVTSREKSPASLGRMHPARQ